MVGDRSSCEISDTYLEPGVLVPSHFARSQDAVSMQSGGGKEMVGGRPSRIRKRAQMGLQAGFEMVKDKVY